VSGAVGPDAGRHGRWFWGAVVAGCLIAAVGVRTYLDVYADASRRVALVAWIVGSDVVHDALVVPATIAIGLFVQRWVPARVRPAARFGLIASGTVVLLAWRPLTHSGAAKHNATVQPLDYPTATATALAVVWAVALAWAAVSGHRRTRIRPPRRSSTRS
jgi:hypothetical protein